MSNLSSKLCKIPLFQFLRVKTRMKTSGHTDTFIRRAVEQGVKAFAERVRRSQLEVDNPRFHPLYSKAGWRKDEKSKEKDLKK